MPGGEWVWQVRCLRAEHQPELLEHRLVERFGAQVEKRRQKFLILLAGCVFVLRCMGWPSAKYKRVRW